MEGLSGALRAAATVEREVVLTFANLAYADFIINGFSPRVVPNLLVIALDGQAHELFLQSGLHSFFAPRMPRIAGGFAAHRTAAFMDIMKLRLLYLVEVV